MIKTGEAVKWIAVARDNQHLPNPVLTLPMLRLLSSKAQGCKDF